MRRRDDNPAAGGMHDKLDLITGLLDDLREALGQTLGCHTLACETLQIGAAGCTGRQFHRPYAAVAVNSQSAQPVTITSSTNATGSAPTAGPGVAILKAGGSGVFNLSGRVVTVFGTPGDYVTVQVFERPQPPAWGS